MLFRSKRWIIRFGAPIPPRGGIKAITGELGEVLSTLAVPVGQRL